MALAICFGLFLPLGGFLILLAAASHISRKLAGLIACSTVFLSFACFAGVFSTYTETSMLADTIVFFSWLPINGIQADFSLTIDSLSLLMALIITGVGFLIHVYSNGYMDHDEDFARYFACLNFFVFSMLLLVLASNVLLLFAGWEGVGLASYLLIGFWHDRPKAASAATKAFVINRIGDLGLLLGLLLTFYTFGTGDFSQIFTLAEDRFSLDDKTVSALTILYFFGAIGKSAQLPLYTWLPDAMEGPTPVSALIHAATMVTAGVYLVVRMHPLFLLAPTVLHLVGIVGAVTALFAAFSAAGQTDLKRVLAFSTVSQLGLMFLACGAGAFYAAMFHLTTHAFVKALLFLSAGNVVHMMHGVTDMGKMGGLYKYFPKTHVLFLIGALALSGIPPLAAFFSKDLILEQEYLGGFEILFVISLAASWMTAFYLTRAYCLTFLGKPNLSEGDLGKLKEAPKIMLVPVMLLALLTLLGGFLGAAFNHVPPLQNFLAKSDVDLPKHEISTIHLSWETLLAMIGAFVLVIVALILYTRYSNKLGHTSLLLKRAFYIDDLYQNAIATPLQKLSVFICAVVEPKFFDGSIRAISRAAQDMAFGLQRVQSGQIRSYVALMFAAASFVIVYFIF